MSLSAKPSARDVDLIATNAVANAYRELPFNAQDPDDQALAEYFFNKTLLKVVKPRVDKYEKKIKDAIKAESQDDGAVGHKVTENYQRKIEYGTPRQTFDKDAFINAVAAAFPSIPKHKLTEIAGKCTKESATPISLDVEYIGDVARAKA